MSDTQIAAARTFLAMHRAPAGFVLPNAWDPGSALILAAAGFPAIATTSAGIAFSLGKQDYDVSTPSLAVGREQMLERIAEIVRASPIPVNGDLEDGWGAAPREVAATITLGIQAGLAGGNIEDKDPRGGLYDEDLAVERIAAAAAAGGDHFVLNARTDALLAGAGLEACIRRANRFLVAGAHCVFTPGAPDLDAIALLAREIDGPLNIVAGLGAAPRDANAILAAGAQRVSVGGVIARSALAFVQNCVRELRDRGTLDFADRQLSGGEINGLFAAVRARHGQAA